MLKRISFLAFFLAVNCNSSFAHEIKLEAWCGTAQPHRIDSKLKKRLENAGTTLEIRDIQSDAHLEWEAEEQLLVKKIIKVVDSKVNRNVFLATQDAWNRFIDLHSKWLFTSAMYGDAGTLGPIDVSSWHLELRRFHVCELNRYLEQVGG
jgi:hypothetical protein